MSRNTLHFSRAPELASLYEHVNRGTFSFAVLGPSGMGKTTLLRNLCLKCSENSALVPVYCLCKSGDPTGCNIATIEQSFQTNVFQPLGLAGEFGAVLLNRIHRDVDLAAPVDDKEVSWLMPLLERFIEPNAQQGYGITLAEATACFNATLANAVQAVASSKTTVLVVDCDGPIETPLVDILLSSVDRCRARLKIVVALETETSKSTDEILAQRFEWHTTLRSFGADITNDLVANYLPAAPHEFTSELLARYRGDPLITDTALRIARLSSVDSQTSPRAHDTEYAALAQTLYAKLGDSPRTVVEALSVLHDGGDVELVSKILEIPLHEVLRICTEEPLIATLLSPEPKSNVQIDLYHAAFKRHVSTLIDPKRQQELRRKVGICYLNALNSPEMRISCGAALSIPDYLADSEPRLFVTSVLRTLSLSILIGNSLKTKQNVNVALAKAEDGFERAMLLIGLSLLLLEQGDLGEATARCFEALSLLRRTDQLQVIQAYVLGNLAFLLQLQNRLPEALKCEEQALGILKQFSAATGTGGGLSAHLSNAALLHQKLGNFHDSLRYYQEALAEDKRTNNLRGVASDLRRIGALLQDLGQLDTAIENHRQALEIDKTLKDVQAVAWDSGNLGVAHSLKGDHAEALLWLKRAVDLFGQLGAENEAAQAQKLIEEITVELRS